jgi:dihydrofolate reductase
MKTILIFVCTLDGKITKWGDPHIRAWSSRSDQEYFDATWKETRVIIMGSRTYDPDPIQPDPNHLFIVITRDPSKYKNHEKPGEIEFTNEFPQKLLNRLEAEGIKTVLIAGGSQIATLFLREQLVDELWLTIEPRIFGSGAGFVSEEQLDIKLEMISCDKVNDQGTLITRYRILTSKATENS